jgi:UDP-glucose 4-epimerase
MNEAAPARLPFRRAVVTGGAGFIGSHLVDRLLEEGLDVVAVDDLSGGKPENLASAGKSPRFRFDEADVADLAAMTRSFAGADVVFHNAACKKTVSLRDPTRDVDTNVKGALHVVLAAKACGVRKIVAASTGSVYGEAVQHPQTESHPLSPVSLYGIDKLAGESILRLLGREYGIEVAVLRYFHVYGPRQESGPFGGVVAIFSRALLAGEVPTIFGDGSQERSFTYVGDIVAANLLAAASSSANGEVYNCASGLKITVRELFDQLAVLADRPGLSPRFGDWTPGDIKHFDVGNERIRRLGQTSWTPFPEGLARTFEWFREALAAERVSAMTSAPR